jgi:hypothetical protein
LFVGSLIESEGYSSSGDSLVKPAVEVTHKATFFLKPGLLAFVFSHLLQLYASSSTGYPFARQTKYAAIFSGVFSMKMVSNP